MAWDYLFGNYLMSEEYGNDSMFVHLYGVLTQSNNFCFKTERVSYFLR